MQQWPEGPVADPAAARERYDRDLRTARARAREAVRADLPAAHLGAGIVVVASVVAGWFAGLATGGLVAGGFALLLLVARAGMSLRGIRGADAWWRSYLLTFGWANWI